MQSMLSGLKDYPTTLGGYEWWKDSSIEVKYNEKDALYHGGGYKFEEKEASVKDLEKIASKIEASTAIRSQNTSLIR